MADNGPDERLLSNTFGIDPTQPTESPEQRLALAEQHLKELPPDSSPEDRLRVELDIAEARLAMGAKDEAWNTTRALLDKALQHEAWQEAVEACEILYHVDHELSLAALGQGVWLSVTYPVSAYITTTMLHFIVDETPDQSDGGAVAAAVAHYIADLRATGKDHENLVFFTGEKLAQVAKRHRNIEGDEMIKLWMEMLDLNNPEELLARLAQIVDVLVGDNWWFDRDALRARLPVN